MIKKLFIIIFITLFTSSYAQQKAASPYSFYGIGDLSFKGTVENKAMGGLSMYTDSIHINLQNPASYSNLQLTTYTVAGSYNSLKLKSESSSEAAETISFDYLSVAFPVGEKLGVGFGLMPYTTVGYQLETIDDSGAQTILDRYNGEGGLNRVHLSLGYAITKEFSVGMTMNYDFGKLQNENLRIIEDVELATKEINRSDLSGIDFNLALNYKKQVTDKLTLYSSILYNPQANITSENSRTIGTVTFDAQGNEIFEEEEQVDLQALNLAKTKLILPASTTIGVGLAAEKKWFLGAEYKIQKISKFDNPFLNIDNIQYEDASRFAIGGFFIPKYDSFTNYWNRVTYRAGMQFEKTGMRINDTSINNFGISFGVGLPLGNYVPTTNSLSFAGLFSNLNIGFDFGQRGTTDAGLIKENYVNLNISLSLNDKWFVKRKYK